MALQVDGVTVRYGDLTAVSGVDLSVADGEVLALLGPSGCGKSTLLRAVAGLERPTAGAVRWDGRDLADVPVHRREFGLVFQDGQLFPHRDVAGNVAFGLRMRGTAKGEQAARVAELLDLVGLGGYQRRRVTELSGGEQQRVALARALAPHPRLLLLDEPLSALDRALRDQLAVDLADLLRRTATTALLVTHDHDEAFTLADRVAVMSAGRLLQVGRPAEVWRRPASEEVARFLGCTSVVPGRVEDGVVSCALGGAPVDGDVPAGPVRVGLRATALRVAAEQEAGAITAEVVQRVHRREHARLLVRVPEVGTVEATAPVATAPEPGASVRLALDPDGLALLPV
ncbi:thiamine transport system ATP-binding protein [Streptoalloteichus tenebrarius]|uniref:Thiamine transport system ATP-binding protein n=1 Tax=Streptoalloteichus tenebrarius (strain ATCC 17920 / DSM 40477 / JCM 4838 / CBS 697.72 / NBRC 16177 / NCIMB 11028 / NRRL B-12390 / A12253. 1 / ISP 5477) TaxID=1933 RepID=A0ABT1HTP1_STRSD|nr:ABC transporter ATP-binding protein [Streptoalloteichus tenebrarius]MCP2258900.1 thiamine transport system ATP-binding protein [Streptoalloteichus tenebrarius]BFF01108.1 ABC transporter ATP-binding protein [Streptoalloteichus tenebrarius]